ncbi:MAG: hypothetical protein WDN24_03145 [Sphingomonas sp.]
MVALAAALSLGVAMPATAQKAKSKPKEAADAPLQVGPEYRKVAAAAENALKAQDFAAAATKVGEAETLAKNDDEKYYAADLRLRLGIAQHNKVDQLKAIDVLILSPRTPPERARVLGAYQQFSLGSTAMEKKDFAGAIPYLLKARELGSTEIDLPICSPTPIRRPTRWPIRSPRSIARSPRPRRRARSRPNPGTASRFRA